VVLHDDEHQPTSQPACAPCRTQAGIEETVSGRTDGAVLRRLRVEVGLTLADLASRAGVGVRTIGDIERGVARRPQRATLEAIATALGAGPTDRDALLAIGRRRSSSTSAAPDVVDDFTGREHELRRILDRLGDDHATVVVVSGGPGVGKSTLAAEALRVRGSRWLHVDLGGQSAAPLSPLDVVRRLVSIATDGTEDAPTEFDAAASRWRALRDEHGHAVLLDDAADEAQVRPVLEASGLAAPVIVTARRLLAGLDAGLRVTVTPFEQQDGLALLERIVPDAAGHPSLSALAERCAGVPLALRIAGSRVAAPGADLDAFLRAIVTEEQRLAALHHGDRSVEAAFAVSYRALPASTARVFRSLAVIDGTTFDAWTGGAALGLGAETAEDALEDLVDLGLVEPRGGNRYRVHDLLRAFAGVQLVTEDGATARDARRSRLHSAVLGRLADAAGRFGPGAQSANGADAPDAARRWIVGQVDHWWPAFRALVDAGDHTAVARTASELQWFSNLWPAWGHWYELFGDAVEAARRLDDRAAESRLLGLQTWAALMERGDRDGALELATAGLAAADTVDDDLLRANAEYHVAWAHLALRQPLLALPHIESAIDGNTRAGDDAALVQCRSMAGAALHLLGRHDEAIVAFRGVLDDLDRAPQGDPGMAFTRVVALEEIAKSANALGRWAEARDAADSGLAIAAGMAWDTGAARALRQRAEALLGSGSVAEALADAERAVALVDADRADAQALAVLGELRELVARARRTTAAAPDPSTRAVDVAAQGVPGGGRQGTPDPD
jgi:transcriptional regulator with XRE-family HTH domain/tetratricopeptide (TPR) repeat protein